MMTSCTRCLTVLLCVVLLLQPGAQTIAVNDVNVWTSWSPCSKMCGPGISTRQCQTSASRDKDTIVLRPDKETCTGSSTQIKLCNMQPCPSDQASTHQTYCSLYNFRTFSGRKYVWEPFIHPTDPCKLSCRAKGEHFYANLPDKAENGSPCTLSTGTAVCVNGVCKQVGCDGVVESTAVKDTCGVCKGDGSSCQTISGIFTSTDLKPGLNYVISIPGGSTNINITELQASRNFLILQTVDGRYIINNQSSSSFSSAIEAAGTVFRHEVKVSPHRKESITSSGPTNITVVFKILLRGRNPGILYSFSVPRDVGEAVIQQIKHRSRPIEIPQEHEKDRNVPDSSSRNRNFSPMMKYTSKFNHNDWSILPRFKKPVQHNHSLDKTEHHRKANFKMLGQKTPQTSYDETSALNIYESTNLTQLMPTVSKTSNTLATDLVTPNPKDTGHNKNDLTVARNNTSSQKMFNAENIFQNQRHNFTFDKILNRTKLLSLEKEDHEDNLHLNKDSSLNKKNSYHGAVNWSDLVLNKGQRKYRNTENTTDVNETDHTSKYAIAPSNLSNHIVDNAVKDFHVMFVNSSHSMKNTSEISIQSERTPLSSLAAPNEVENWNPDGESYDLMDTRNTSVTTTSNIRQSTIDTERHEAENIQHASSSGNQAVAYGNKLNSSESPDKESLSKHTEHGVFSAEKYSSSKANNADEGVDKIKALKADSQHIFTADNSRYMVPRYSQSFKFPHIYKDNYNADLLSGRSSRPKVSYHRQNHSNYTHNFLNVSNKTLSQHIDHEDKQSRRTSTSSNVNQVDSTNAHFIALEASNRDVLSVSSTVLYSKSTVQHSAPDTNQTIETINKNKHNHDTAVVEGKWRLEERINRFNDRVREFQDRMKQKQAEIAASRRADQKKEDTKVDNDTNGFGISNFQRKSVLFDRFSPQQSQTAKDTSTVLPLGIVASFTHSKSNPPHSQDSHSGQIKRENSETSFRAYTNFPPTTSRVTTLQTENSPHIRDSVLPHVEYPNESNTQKDIILGRQFVQHEHTNFNYSKQNHPHDPSVDFSVHDRNHETSSASPSVHVQPFIVLSQNGEIPDTLTEHKKQYGGSHASSGSEHYRQENLARPPPHGAGTSPLISTALSHIPLMNQSWSNELALERTVGSNQLENEDPGRQSSPSTHSLVYEWKVSGLTQCTHSCGGGIQQTVIVCVDTVTQAVVTDENCRHFQRPKLLAVPCNTRPCSAEWIPGPWSSCSASCGTGEQTRTVTCQARVSPTLNMTMASSSCEGQDRIPDRQACGTSPCSSWQVGVWSNCSALCGDGHQSRNVSCVGVNLQILSDKICTDIKPHSQEPCNLGECGKGWLFTEWSQCSSECGAGVVKRQVFCADEKGSTLPNNRCDNNHRPPLTQSCRATKLCGALWFAGHWSQCDVKCGSGHKRRHVICAKEQSGSVFSVVGEDNCTDVNKPAEIEPCQLPPCVSEWYMTSWSQCSKTCGIGSKTREVRCLDPDQNPADDCPHEARPKTRESCNTHSCSSAIIEGETPDCLDKFNQCSVVKRARLCRYNYYKRVCCKSCAEHFSTTIASDITSN